MKIQNFTPNQAPRTLNTPKQDPPQPGPGESFARGDRAFEAASNLSRSFTSWNMASGCGVTAGVGVGALLQATVGSTPLSIVVGGAVGLAAAYGGYQLGGDMSDWAGKLGARVDKNRPERGEAIGRSVMNAATGLVFVSSPALTGVQLGLTALNGGLTYALDK